MRLYLVRHGRAAAGVEDLDPGLDTVGQEQALRAARALSGSGAVRLVVSPLRRTRETAAPIAAALGLEPQIEEAVAEVFDPTMAPDRRSAMLGPLLGGRWSEQSPALRAFRDGVVSALRELSGGVTIVVSHFVAINAAIGEATGDDRVMPGPLANASITRMDVTERGLVLVGANDTAHLTPELETGSHTGMAGRSRSSS